MRLLIACLLLGPLPIKACESSDKDEWTRVYDPDSLELCSTDEYQDHGSIGDDHDSYIAYPIEVSPRCGCITAGMYKYLYIHSDEKRETMALVDFGYGECDGWAVKTLCAHGECHADVATMCKFALSCGPSAN